MKKSIFLTVVLILVIALSGCDREKSSTAQTNSSSNMNETQTTQSSGQSNAEKEIKAFSVEPAAGWELLKSASTDTFKSYNLLEPYTGSANFWLKGFGADVFSGKKEEVMGFFEEAGYKDIEFVSLDELDYEMPVIRCIIKAKVMEIEQTQGHYFIDTEGFSDIYFQLSAPPDNFSKAQSVWEEALNTLKIE